MHDNNLEFSWIMGSWGEGALLQPVVTHNFHVSDEIQQVSLGQVRKLTKNWFVYNLLCCSHVCSFWVGSTNFDETKMTFDLGRLTYDKSGQNPVLDYITEIEELPDRLDNKLYYVR